MAQKKKKQIPHKHKQLLRKIGITAALVIIVILLAFRLSPWPGAFVIRSVFNNGGGKTLKAMEPFAPKSPVTAVLDQQYDNHGKSTKLDVYYPESVKNTDRQLPVVIWTHGGAWLSGDKKDSGPYFKLLAAEGYTVVAPNYSLAPRSTYPKAIHELNQAYAYLQKNDKRLHADMSQVVLAGDSAGAQLSAQMAALVTNQNYAKQVNIKPNLTPEQLKGVVLNCGIYKMKELAHPAHPAPKLVGWGTDVTVWAYSGTHDYNHPVIKEMSPYYHLTSQFPATYISGGNGDPLTDVQSKPFATQLENLKVPVTKLFFDENHQPALPHEYQFNLDTKAAQTALTQTKQFLKARLN